MEFRTDINGLRAYAVLAVLLFHFSVPGFSGGFVGVDVFFVLSGYLMTAIIVGGIAKGDFSLTGFYLARARRILPALAVLCLVLLALGWWLLTPSDYKLLGKHTTAAIAFASNFTFRDEEGYFDIPSQTKWLLHSWSLAVEWQFYLIYPLLLLAMKRWLLKQRSRAVGVLWVLAAMSFAASVVITAETPVTAFYLLPTRAWEMLAGGLVFLHRGQLRMAHPRMFEALGLMAIATAVVLFKPDMLWPGYAALLPVMGTVLVLLSERGAFTANPLAQRLGDWSYSVYLWHWPVAVLLIHTSEREGTVWMGGGILFSVLLGYLSARFIEAPTRRLPLRPRGRAVAVTLGTMAVIALLGVLVDKQEGFPDRVSDQVAMLDAERENYYRFTKMKPCGFNRETHTLTPCDINAEQGIRWVVWGDSHAGSILGGVREALPGGIRFYSHQCALMFNTELKTKGRDNGCTAWMRQAWEQVQALPGDVTIIVVNRYAVNLMGPNEGTTRPTGFVYTDMGPEQKLKSPKKLYRTRLSDTLCTLAGKHAVAAVMPIPEIGIDVPRLMAREHMEGDALEVVTIPREEYRRRNKTPVAALNDAAQRCGVTLLDPTPYLCDDTRCYGARDGEPYYTDDDHLSLRGAKLLVPMFSPLK